MEALILVEIKSPSARNLEFCLEENERILRENLYLLMIHKQWLLEKMNIIRELLFITIILILNL